MNPFKYGNIVSGAYFYDREDELLRIKQTLEGGNNLMLYAPRRYGKSSLVSKALVELDNKGITTVYIDFMSIYSRNTFVKNYTKAIVEQQKVSLEKFTRKIAEFIRGIVPSLSFDSQGNPAFSVSWVEGRDKEQTLIDTINLPQKLATKQQPWIIAFDEFQEITKLNGESFEKLLRSCIQHHKHVSYLFLGSRTHLLKDMFNNKNRAFYNAAMLMNINTIDVKHSITFLQRRFSKSNIYISEETATYLIDKAAGIPYYIQFIAAEVWQQLVPLKSLTKVSTDNIATAISQIINLKSDYYWELTNNQTNYRKKVLYAISQSADELFSKQTSLTYDLGAVSSTQKAVESFIDQGIIERINNKYEFSDPIYSMFLSNYL